MAGGMRTHGLVDHEDLQEFPEALEELLQLKLRDLSWQPPNEELHPRPQRGLDRAIRP